MTKKQMHQKILEIGGYSTVAKWCGVTRQAVQAWSRFKLKHCIMIHKRSGGQVHPGDLRDDVQWKFSLQFQAGECVGVEIRLDTKQIMQSDY